MDGITREASAELLWALDEDKMSVACIILDAIAASPIDCRYRVVFFCWSASKIDLSVRFPSKKCQNFLRVWHKVISRAEQKKNTWHIKI